MNPLRSKRLLGALLLLSAGPATAAMSLSEALQKALVHDPEIREVMALRDAAREGGIQERSTLMPSLGLSAGAAQARTESNGVFGASKDEYPSWSAGLEARQPLFRLDWFSRGARADAKDQLAEVEAQQRRLLILQKVAARYFTAVVAHDSVLQAETEAKAVRESLETTRKRFEVGLVPGNDVKEAKARDDLAQAQVLSAKHEMQSALDSLSELTQDPGAVLPALPEDMRITSVPAEAAERWMAAAQGNNPEVRIARLQLELAQTQVMSRRSEAAPSLDLVGQVFHEDTSEFAFGQKVDDRRVGLELKVPLYAGGINSSRVREAVARATAAESALQRVSQQVAREARQRYREIVDGEAQIAALQQVLASSQDAETAVRNGYEAGTRTIGDVLDARSRVVQSRRQLGQSRARLLLNLLELRRVTGGLSEKDFSEVDSMLGLKNNLQEGGN